MGYVINYNTIKSNYNQSIMQNKYLCKQAYFSNFIANFPPIAGIWQYKKLEFQLIQNSDKVFDDLG